MIWITLAVLLGIVAFAAVIGLIVAVIETLDYDLRHGGLIILGCVVLTVVGTVGTVKSAIAANRHYGTESCESFAAQTGYETRYLVTTVFDGGKCYALFDGNWVPKDQLWAELGGRS